MESKSAAPLTAEFYLLFQALNLQTLCRFAFYELTSYFILYNFKSGCIQSAETPIHA